MQRYVDVLLVLAGFALLSLSASMGSQERTQQGTEARNRRETEPARGGRRGAFTFEQFARRHDANRDGKITREEFKGMTQFFKRLDGDSDDVITEAEFKAAVSKVRQASKDGGRAVPDGVKAFRDLEYAHVNGQSLKLDLYVPQKPETKPPLLVWIHGGGWTRGNKSQINPTFIRLTGKDYAAASVEYRLEGLSSHPQQIHDCKGAIRWLRANAEKHGYDATRIGVGGGSAGGHLALLLGMSAGVEELEGDVGGNLDQPSRVHAIVDLFGPSALDLFAKENTRFAFNKTPELLKSANPLTYLSEDDPPVIIFYGDQDSLVPRRQNEVVHERYQEAGLKSSLHLIKGAGHGGSQFSDETRYALVRQFVDQHIKQIDDANAD